MSSLPQNAAIINSLTPIQRRIWYKVRAWDGDDYIPTGYIASAWGPNTTSLIGWKNTLYVQICRMNKHLAPHGLALRGRAVCVTGGYRLVCLESEAS